MSTAFEKQKLCHSLGRPSRSDFVHFEFAVDASTALPTGKDKEDLRLTLGVVDAVNAGYYDVEIISMDNANYAVSLLNAEDAFHIKARPITVDWGTTAFVYTAKTHKVVPTITNLVAEDSCEITLKAGSVTSEKAANLPGTHYSAEIESISNNNYTLTGATGTTCDWTITYAKADDATISPESVLSGEWYKTSVILVAPIDYVISTQNTNANAGWDTTLTVATEGENQTITYYLQYVGEDEGAGAITDKKTVTVNIDTTSPKDCEINIAGNPFKEFFNTITFGLFFKESVDVTISATDAVSGIASYEWQMVEDVADYNADGPWNDVDEVKDGKGIFSIEETAKGIVYAKITDNAGHTTIINSNGIVVYTDVAQESLTATYTKTTKADVTVSVTEEALKGNTIKAVSYNNVTLPAGAYTVDGVEICLDGEYLDENFAAGTYTFKVSYNPLGVATEETVEISLTDINLTVKKQVLTDPAVLPTITFDSNTVYDGAPTEISATNNSVSTGAVKLYYKPASALDDDAYVEGTPTNVGTYDIKAVVEADDNYEAISTEVSDFVILPRRVVVSAGVITVMANSDITVDLDKVVVENIADGHSVGAITVSGTNTTVTDNGTYTLSDLVILDANDEVVTGNYDPIIYVDGTLKVEHDTSLTPSEMTVEVPEYKAGDEFKAEDLTVVVSYEDGYSREVDVTEFTVDASDLDMSTIGEKTIVVSFEDNGETISEEVTFVVAHNPLSKPEKLTVAVPDYVSGDTFEVDELTVVVTYEDGYSREVDVTEFTVDTSDLDMSKAGEQTITVSYEENGKTVSEEVTFIVAHNETCKPVDLTVEVPTYLAGDTFEEEELVVEVIYEDGYSKEVTDFVVDASALDMSKVGNQTITVSYTENDETVSKDVTVVVAHNPLSKPEKLIVAAPDYESGDTFNVEDLTVVVRYEDGYTIGLDTDDIDVDTSELDMSKAGEQTITVSYTENGKTVSKEVVLVVEHNEESRPKELTVTVPTYLAGDEFAKEDLTVMVTYEDDYTRRLDATEILVDTLDLDMNKVGNQTITVSYTENGTTLEVVATVVVEHNPASKPAKLTVSVPDYVSGDEFDADDLTVVVTYEDGYTEELDASDLVVDTSDLDMDKAGEQIITVSYRANGKTVEVEVPVVVEHNELSKPVDLTVSVPDYVSGDEFAVEDLTVVVTYEDGYTKEVTDFEVDTTALDMEKAGNQMITVSYTENGETVTKEVPVIVAHNEESKPADITVELPEYVSGDSFDVDDLVVKVTYEDGYTEEVEAEDVVIDTSDLDMSKAGEQTITVSYTVNGETVTKEVTVVVEHNETCKPVDLEVEVPSYVAGDEFAVEDLTVVVTYEDGYSKEVTNFVVDTAGLDMDKAGEQTITVSYAENGKTVTEEVKVVVAHNTTLAPSGLVVEGIESEYTVGEEIDPAGITVTVTYEDGYTEVLDATEYTTNIDEIDMSVVGEKKLVVTYGEGEDAVTEEVTFTVKHDETLEPSGIVVDVLESFLAGDEIDLDDITVKLTYEDGYEEVLDATEFTTNIDEIDMDVVGEKKLVVTYGEGEDAVTIEVTFTVTHDETLKPSGLVVTGVAEEYTAGEEIDPADITVTVTYEDGYEEVLDATEYTTNIDEIDMSVVGEKKLVVTYGEGEDAVTAEVAFVVTLNYTVTVSLESYEFVLSEDLDAEGIKAALEAGIEVKVTFENGSELVVTDYTTNIDEIDWATPGVKTLEVTYEEAGASKTVEVLVVIKEQPEEGSEEGDGKVEVIPGEGAPETNIENTNTEELKEELLTDTEKAAVEAGEDYKIYLEVKDISDEVSDEHKAEVAEKMTAGQQLGAYIDISLYTKVGNNEATKISESDVPIEITIVMPEELRAPEGKVRTYKIVRVHELGNGQKPEVTVIDLNAVDGEAYTYSFTTDRFSTYAIIYTETNASGGNNGGGSGSGSGNDSNDDVSTESTGTEVPKTGDEATPFVWSVALLAAMSALSVCVKRLSKKRR